MIYLLLTFLGRYGIKKFLCNILPPSQNISKIWSTKVNVCGSKFVPNTSTYVDSFLLIFWDRVVCPYSKNTNYTSISFHVERSL